MKRPRIEAEVSTDAFYTPPDLVQRVRSVLGEIDLDPAWHPHSFTAPKLGVAQNPSFSTCAEVTANWETWPRKALRGFCNPPYSRGNVARWLASIAEHSRRFQSVWIVLLKVDTSTRWFSEHCWPRRPCSPGRPTAVSFLRSRVRFCEPSNDGTKPAASVAKWPVCVLLHNPKAEVAIDQRFFETFGGAYGAIIKDVEG